MIIVLVKITTTVDVVETVRGSTPQVVVGPGSIVAITRKEVDVVGAVVVIVVGGSSIIVVGAVVVEVAVAVAVAVAVVVAVVVVVAVTIDTIFGVTTTRYHHHCHKTKMVIMPKITDKKWLHINANLDSEHRAMKTKGWK